jgi:hypothetical protein
MPRCNAAVGAINGPRFHDAMFPSVGICVNLQAAAAYLVCDSNQWKGITSKSDGLKVRRRAAFLMHWISKLLMHEHEASRMSGRATAVSAEARRKIGEADRRFFFSAGPLCRTIWYDFGSFLNKQVLISRSIEFFELYGASLLVKWSR